MAKPTSRESIKSVHHSWKIIEVLREKQVAGVTEIANEIEISPAAVHKHLGTLCSEDIVYKIEGDYSLSYKMLKISNEIRNNSPVFRVAKPELDKLARKHGFCVHLLVEHQHKGVYLYNHMNELAPNHSILGKREPLHVSAGGKSLLAFMEPEIRDKIYNNVGLPKWTENTITDSKQLEEQLEEVRENDLAFNDEETFKGHRAVASSVRDSNGKPICAVSVSESVGEFTGDRFRKEVPSVVKKVAKSIELNYQLENYG